VRKICILVAVTLFGWIGWWLGAHVGLLTAYFLSVVGSTAGVYVGWRIHRDYLT
jgi:hypothetical protein